MKKLISFLLIINLLITLTSCVGINDTSNWKIQGKTLILSGDGQIGDFCHDDNYIGAENCTQSDGSEIPWADANFDTVIIEGNITHISAHAFAGFEKLKKVIINVDSVVIEHRAFMNCKSLKTIENLDRVTEIGQDAFSGCTSLISLTFGEKLDLIRNRAFASCTGLKTVHLPASLNPPVLMEKDFGFSSVFKGCTSLEAVTVADGNPFFTSQDGVIYDDDMYRILYQPPAKQDPAQQAETVPSAEPEG